MSRDRALFKRPFIVQGKRCSVTHQHQPLERHSQKIPSCCFCTGSEDSFLEDGSYRGRTKSDCLACGEQRVSATTIFCHIATRFGQASESLEVGLQLLCTSGVAQRPTVPMATLTTRVRTECHDNTMPCLDSCVAFDSVQATTLPVSALDGSCWRIMSATARAAGAKENTQRRHAHLGFSIYLHAFHRMHLKTACYHDMTVGGRQPSDERLSRILQVSCLHYHLISTHAVAVHPFLITIVQ